MISRQKVSERPPSPSSDRVEDMNYTFKSSLNIEPRKIQYMTKNSGVHVSDFSFFQNDKIAKKAARKLNNREAMFQDLSIGLVEFLIFM